MKGDVDVSVYMMANEKMVSMLSVIEQTMEFLNEYGVKPDDEVKKEMNKAIESMKKWIK